MTCIPRAIKNAYHQHYRKKLEDDLRGDTSGDFRRLLISMCACSRDETSGDVSLAPNLAQMLYKAGGSLCQTLLLIAVMSHCSSECHVYKQNDNCYLELNTQGVSLLKSDIIY